MDTYTKNLYEEREYLRKALVLINKELEKETSKLEKRKKELLEMRREMWENTAHHSLDFTKLTEINEYLSLHGSQMSSFGSAFKQIEKYKKMLSSPYFGRFDFREDDLDEVEKIYVGLHNIIDVECYNIVIYDWRAPISSIFYQYELGEGSYQAPQGTISGDISLKRQYRILNGELEYYIDCSLKIDDEMLQSVLCRNTSTKMRNIVETIQKEQNYIIRDMENELLIVQGVPGSGKTSIALHRIAFLLYNGINSNFNANNVVIISPNEIFSSYISGVLPELGEENVNQITYDDLGTQLLGNRFCLEEKLGQLEWMVESNDKEEGSLRRSSIAFKGSRVFVEILNRLIKYYLVHVIDFQDIYYANRVVESKDVMKNQFLNDKIGLPISKRLKRIENILLEKIHPLRKERLTKIESIVQTSYGHELEIKSFSRLLSMKRSKNLVDKIRNFTEIDFFKVYSLIFEKEELFYKLAKGLELPKDIEEIIKATKKNLENHLLYEDWSSLLFLKLKIEGVEAFSDIKHVIVDEAQDYDQVHYEVFKLLFKDARFTVLGDIHQSIGRDMSLSFYDDVERILNKKKSIHLRLNKSYRSSYEISAFSRQILDLKQEAICFERHEPQPIVANIDSIQNMDSKVLELINEFVGEGHKTIAIICKTVKDAEDLHLRLKELVTIKLVHSKDDRIEDGIMILPGYMIKGLEFDAVIVYNGSNENYCSEQDRRLLFIACTRALHRLAILYTGKKSNYLP